MLTTVHPAWRRIDAALERFYVACGAIAAVFLVLVGSCVLVSILSRAAGLYVAGINEYSGYAMAASSFFALAHTLREGGHIRVALIRSRLGEGAKLILEIWCLVIGAAMSTYLAWYLIKLTWVSYRFEERSEGAAATLLWIPQTLVAAGSIVFAISMVHGLIRVLATRNPEAAAAAPRELTAE